LAPAVSTYALITTHKQVSLQKVLGHESLETTQIYTHVTISELKAAQTKYNPSERLEKIANKGEE